MLRHGNGVKLANSVRGRFLSLPVSARSSAAIGLRHFSNEQPSGQDNIAVIGGGITGLASAYYLTKELPRAKITIYEASDRIGGWLSSKRVPVKDGTVLFEAGPRTLRPSGNGVLSARLLQELDLAKDTIFPQRSSPAARNRYVYYPDHLVCMPHPSYGIADNLWSLLTEPIFEKALWSGFTEIFKDPRSEDVKDESVGEFFSRRLSKPVVDRILSAVLHGIYAGDAWQLSAKSLFTTAWRDEANAGIIFAGMLRSRADGVEVTKREAEYLKEMKSFNWDPLLRATLRDSTVFTFRDGLGMLVDRMARYLVQDGRVEFKTSTPVEDMSLSEDRSSIRITSKEGPAQYDHAISSLSPGHLNLASKNSGTTALVPAIPSVTVMTVNLYYRTPDLNPPGFGYVIPLATPFENNPERALGVVFDTAYSPSAKDLDQNNWQITNVEELKEARENGQLINVNDFAWYNMPERPVIQDDVKERGTKLTVMLGGHWWNDWPVYPDEQEGLALAKGVVERHLGIKEEPEVYSVNLQKDCIPQYTVGHESRLKTAHSNLSQRFQGRLRVAGSWMNGVGVNDCLRSAYEVVKALKTGRDGTGLEHVGANEYVRLKAVRAGQKAQE
ncbi:hypothetical protein D0869_03398 [Hortaea werneckii]|uniref:Protoporphyrinogen oxidase n=1 Tax=Hortaea werneckii TaxID=91943 RepID=A0A3M6X5E7_HORWE|nr:Protoporphyrinogen oxidase [Hortaea werneckii]RMX86017.1 hypothetical protein D0869_03398 [Hortaea werneckii]RMY13496.1 hypothetical protein D0868_01973 [Hortaea werneckii]